MALLTASPVEIAADCRISRKAGIFCEQWKAGGVCALCGVDISEEKKAAQYPTTQPPTGVLLEFRRG